MSETFWVFNLPENCYDENYKAILHPDVIKWLSINLRRRQYIHITRRYRYIKTRRYITSTGKIKYYNIGVIIHNKEDAMAFKLRWL